jgi:hypothetical protein
MVCTDAAVSAEHGAAGQAADTCVILDAAPMATSTTTPPAPSSRALPARACAKCFRFKARRCCTRARLTVAGARELLRVVQLRAQRVPQLPRTPRARCALASPRHPTRPSRRAHRRTAPAGCLGRPWAALRARPPCRTRWARGGAEVRPLFERGAPAPGEEAMKIDLGASGRSEARVHAQVSWGPASTVGAVSSLTSTRRNLVSRTKAAQNNAHRARLRGRHQLVPLRARSLTTGRRLHRGGRRHNGQRRQRRDVRHAQRCERHPPHG